MIDAPESRKSSEPIWMGKPFSFGKAPCSWPVPGRNDVSRVTKPLPPSNAGDEFVRACGTSNFVASSAKLAFDMATARGRDGAFLLSAESICRGA